MQLLPYLWRLLLFVLLFWSKVKDFVADLAAFLFADWLLVREIKSSTDSVSAWLHFYFGKDGGKLAIQYRSSVPPTLASDLITLIFMYSLFGSPVHVGCICMHYRFETIWWYLVLLQTSEYTSKANRSILWISLQGYKIPQTSNW